MTDKVTLTSASEWVAIGTAPALVSNASVFPIMVQVEASAPAANEVGHVIAPGAHLEISTPGTVYGRLFDECQIPASVIVTPTQSLLSRVPAMVANLIPVKTLLAPGACYTLTTTATTANQALQAGIKAVSIYARNSDAFISLGNGSQTATASKIFIAAGERLDFDVTGYASPNIACIFGPSGAAAILHIVELS